MESFAIVTPQTGELTRRAIKAGRRAAARRALGSRAQRTVDRIDRVLERDRERAASKPPACPYCQAPPGVYAQHPAGPCPSCGRGNNGYDLGRGCYVDERGLPTRPEMRFGPPGRILGVR